MATITCYQYNGLPNVLDKTDDLVEYGQFDANIITDEKTILQCTLEVSSYLNSISLRLNTNYVKFMDWGGRLTYWFVDTISRDGVTWYYHLRLDVLMTNKELIGNSTQIIERSSTLSPSADVYNDNLWLIPNNKRLKKLDGFNSFSQIGKNIVMTTITPTAPTSSVRYDLHKGNISSYILNGNEYNKIASKFWTQSFYEALVQYITSPLASVMGVMVYPFDISPFGAQSDGIGFGDIKLQTETDGVTDLYDVALTSIRTIDFGSISITREYNDFRDFEPYTTYSIYLPFYGFHQIDIKRFINGLSVSYDVDITSGDTRISLKTNIGGSFVEVEYIMTSMGIQIPFTSSGAPDMAGTATRMTISAISSLATNMTPSLQFESASSKSTDVEKEGRRIKNKRITSESSESTSAKFYPSGEIGQSVSSALSPVSIASTGSATPNTFDLSITSPFIIISYPYSPNFDLLQKEYYGRLVMVQRTLSTIPSGFQKIYKPRLNMVGLCIEEYNEIVYLLESGIFMKSFNI